MTEYQSSRKPPGDVTQNVLAVWVQGSAPVLHVGRARVGGHVLHAEAQAHAAAAQTAPGLQHDGLRNVSAELKLPAITEPPTYAQTARDFGWAARLERWQAAGRQGDPTDPEYDELFDGDQDGERDA